MTQSQWTSEYAILRDLSVAQGRVPVAIEGTVGAGEKPPALKFTEETEEEFFMHCSADADVSAAPDLYLIKKMLDMMRDLDQSSDDENNPNKILLISKLNPNSQEFVPNNATSSKPDKSPNKETRKPPRKRQRNVALESILQTIADNERNGKKEITPEPMKLLKPNDFVTNNNIEHDKTVELIKPVQAEQSKIEETKSEPEDKTTTTLSAVQKVNGWFETQTDSPFPKKTSKVTLEATNMFRKKSVAEKVKKVENNDKSPASSSRGEYKPSLLANEYYKKFVERSKFKESVKDDIWAQAVGKMKDIDEKRRREALAKQASSASQASDNENQSFEDTQSTDTFTKMNLNSIKVKQCLDIVSLPRHRHQLSEECIVCKVILKKNTDLTKEDGKDIKSATE